MTVYPNPTMTTLPPNSEESGPPLSSPNATYPVIPTGMALINPLMLSDSDSSCSILAQDPSAPNFFSQGSDLLWSCQSDQTQGINAVTWRFEKFPADQQINMANFISQPPFLRGAEYGDGKWGAYQVSSVEGIQLWEDSAQLVKVVGNDVVVEYSGKPTWRDGTQNQPLWHIPFAFYNTTGPDSPTLLPRHISTVTTRIATPTNTAVTSDYTSYKFGVLVDKTVIVKQSTIEANIASESGTIRTGNGTILIPGEIVWKCIWEKTLLEVELFVDDLSEGYSREGLRGSVNKPGDEAHPSHGESSPTGSLPVPQPMGTGDASAAFLGAQQTPDTGPSGNLSMTYRRNSHRKRTSIIGGRGLMGPYPRRISIQESRPTTKRIRQVLGMDLTDPDPDGHADLGAVKCTQFIATPDGGLTPFMDKVSGEGYVVLKEQGGPGARRRRGMHRHKRGTPGLMERAAYLDGHGGPVAARKELNERDSDCFCRWSS